MKNFITTGVSMMAISLTGCNSTAVKSSSYQGRIIEFKSGPEGFDTRTFFYEGEYEVIAFDTQFTPQLAAKSIEHLRTFTQKPITWVVITHPNPDKFNGTSVFKKEGAKIISSKKTAEAIPEVHAYKKNFFVEIAKMFKSDEYPTPSLIDVSFEGVNNLVLKGGEKIELRELSKPGVSVTQTVAFIPSLQSLFVGDLIHYKAHAWLEGGIKEGKVKPTIEGWIEDLKEVAVLYPGSSSVYGGRGETSNLKLAVEEQVQYLLSAQTLIQTTIADLGPDAKEFEGPNASQYYKKLAGHFSKLFPEYSLEYMIEYGSYGLVQQVLHSNYEK